jgi:Flp pilus assembly protein TadG
VTFGRSEKGQAIVEFAMVLPVLVLLIIGLMEFSLVWNSRNTVLFASRDGSMLAAEGGSLDGVDMRRPSARRWRRRIAIIHAPNPRGLDLLV